MKPADKADRGHPPGRGRFWILFFLLSVLVTGVLIASHLTVKDYFLLELREAGRNQLDLNIQALRGKLNQYRTIPAIMARHPLTKAAAGNPFNPAKVRKASALFEETRNLTGAAEIYLLNREGTAIAASNAGRNDSFVGKNYAYRPYFQEAMIGKLGRFFGLGSVSKSRGYYFSTAVREKGRITGVLVVKVDIEELEATLREGDFSDTGTSVLVTDKQGVIFMSNRSEWIFKSMGRLDEGATAAIRASRRYIEQPITLMPVSGRRMDSNGLTIIHLPSRGTGPSLVKPHILLEKPMLDVRWNVSVIIPTRYATAQADLISTLLALLLVLAILIVRATLGKRREMRDKMAAQQEARDQLQKFASELEHRVEQRTRELKQTQNELVQAAKLAALGHMSAGLSHELNQPLTAIKAYAENAVKLLNRSNSEEAEKNLEIISDLITRMSEIIRHLKTFARESSGSLSPIDLNDVISDTVRFMGGRLERNQIEFRYRIEEQPVIVEADPRRLQQVLVNLLGNAIDAMRGSTKRRLELDLAQHRDSVLITVSDTGPGIARDSVGKIFDPFFTTKEVGEGLGLGLSISYNIIKDFNGSLSADNKSGGGAEFRITLPRLSSQTRSGEMNKRGMQ